MDKESNERGILDLVYDESEYAEVIKSEKPDFHIRYQGLNSFFGVEVTELYSSEPNARLRKIPNYFNEIINEDRYRHRVDRTAIEAKDLEIFSADGVFKGKARGIMQEYIKVEDYANNVASIIKSKDLKFLGYEKSLDHINLIIFNGDRRYIPIFIENFYGQFYTPQLKDALFASAFREIFFVTRLNYDKQKDKQIYVPLKMLLLLAELYHFHKIIMEYPLEPGEEQSLTEEEGNETKASFMRAFSQYLRSKTDRVYLREEAGAVEVILVLQPQLSDWAESVAVAGA